MKCLCWPNSPYGGRTFCWYWIHLINNLSLAHISPLERSTMVFCKANVNTECRRALSGWPPITVSLLARGALPLFPLIMQLNYRDSLSAVTSFPFVGHCWVTFSGGADPLGARECGQSYTFLIEIPLSHYYFSNKEIAVGTEEELASEVLLEAIKGLGR